MMPPRPQSPITNPALQGRKGTPAQTSSPALQGRASSGPARRALPVLIVLAALLLVSVVLSTGIGTVALHPLDVLAALRAHFGGPAVDPQLQTIVWDLRLPRIFLALLIGGGLGVAGALMQALFHNPMADPYIVGVSSGAAVGAVTALALGIGATVLGLNATSLLAFSGALAVTLLVYTLSRRGGRVHVPTLLLNGIAVGALASALTAFVLLQQQSSDMRAVLAWLMGGLTSADWPRVASLLPYTVVGVTVALVWQRELNILALGEETAHYLGVDLERTKLLLLAVASLLAAACVAVGGIIAFVGLVVPHLARLLVGPNHRVLLPACVLGGGLLLVWADVVARTIVPGSEVPIGIITSALGSPFFLFLLWRRGSERG
jgi:iron complex transport system permease protein